MSHSNERTVGMQKIIKQAIMDGKRRAEAEGFIDLDFYVIGGYAHQDKDQVVFCQLAAYNYKKCYKMKLLGSTKRPRGRKREICK